MTLLLVRNALAALAALACLTSLNRTFARQVNAACLESLPLFLDAMVPEWAAILFSVAFVVSSPMRCAAL